MKLVQLSEEHYIVVHDSEIKEGDYLYSFSNNKIVKANKLTHLYIHSKKITHSTQPLGFLNVDGFTTANLKHDWTNVKFLPLSEVKELLGVVDIEALEKRYYQQLEQRKEAAKNFTGQVAGRHPDMFGHNEVHNMVRGYLEGYNQALEDNKVKWFTREDIMKAFTQGKYEGVNMTMVESEDYIQSLQPKTEWDVEFVDGKLKLKS